MSALRGDRYASRSDADSIESLSKKLAVDLRKHIRAIVRCAQRAALPWHGARLMRALLQGNFPVLSDGWCAMADSMERVGNITEMVRLRLDGYLRRAAHPTRAGLAPCRSNKCQRSTKTPRCGRARSWRCGAERVHACFGCAHG